MMSSPDSPDPVVVPTPRTPTKQMDREAVVFLIDASPAMLRRAPGATTHAVDGARPDASSSTTAGRGGAGSAVATYLDVALDCARGMLRDRVVAAPSDKQGVVFFNTERTRGLDDHLDGLSARERVYVHHRMAPPSARRIQDLGDFIGSDGVVRFQETVGVRNVDAETAASTGGNATNTARDGNYVGDGYYDALLRAHHVAREMLNDHPPAQRVAKRCLLFTNRDAPLPSNATSDDDTNAASSNEDGRELVGQWREFADVHKIDVRLFALPRTTSENAFDARDSETNAQRSLRIVPFDASKFYDHLLTCCGDASEAEAADAAAPNAEPSGAESGRLISAGHALVAFDASSVPDGSQPSVTENAGGLHGGFGLDMVQRAFRKQTRRARKVRGSFFRFGTEKEHAVAVALYAPFASAKRPKPVKVHCRDLSEVHCETVFVNTAVGAYVEKEQLDKKFVYIGDARAVVTQDELADAKRAVEEDGIHLIGFRENTPAFRESFLRWARTGRPARLMRPAAVDDAGSKSGGKGAKYGGFRGERGDTSEGDASRRVRPLRSEATTKAAECDAFFALADAMRRKNRVGVGIVARTGSRDAGARGCVLVPATDVDGEIIGMRVIDTPFADDIRYPERNHDFAAMADATAAAADATVDEPQKGSAFDDVAGSRGATAEQVRAAEEVIDALAVHAYDPADIANPALARHYRVLECQALDVPWTDADERETDATRPPSTLELERVGVKEPARAFKRSVYGENHEQESLEDAKPAPSKRPRPIGGGLSDDAPIDFASLARDDQLERCTAAALKAYCKENELKTTGVKAALAERVKAHALGG